MFVAFSCQQRCLCSSCHQKRTILVAETIAHTICAPVPHRQLVFTIPKRLRIYCRYDRRLLGGLARAAWRATVEVYRQKLKRRDLIPGMVAGIQTFGELVPGTEIRQGAVVGARSTAQGTYERWKIAVGDPARPLGSRVMRHETMSWTEREQKTG
jgi:hypothetical protein